MHLNERLQGSFTQPEESRWHECSRCVDKSFAVVHLERPQLTQLHMFLFSQLQFHLLHSTFNLMHGSFKGETVALHIGLCEQPVVVGQLTVENQFRLRCMESSNSISSGCNRVHHETAEIGDDHAVMLME